MLAAIKSAYRSFVMCFILLERYGEKVGCHQSLAKDQVHAGTDNLPPPTPPASSLRVNVLTLSWQKRQRRRVANETHVATCNVNGHKRMV